MGLEEEMKRQAEIFGFGTSNKKIRKPIKKRGSVKTELRLRQKGKCWRCHKNFDAMGVARPHIHHKNGN